MTIIQVIQKLRDDLKLWVTNNLRTKVDKEDGKMLSSNDFTNDYKTKLDEVDTNLSNKMDKENPTGTGSFSLNRKADTTIGDCSTAEGYETTASASATHAEGYGTIASGQTAHAEGKFNIAEGAGSHAEGINTHAEGFVSHTEGDHTIAGRKNQHIEGKYNIKETGNRDTIGKYVHIVGNGEDEDNRSNAHTLDWEGNAWFAGDVYVGSTNSIDKDDGSKKLATEKYVDEAIAGSGSSGIYIQATAPENPKDGDIWVDTDDESGDVLAVVATSGSFNDLTDKPTYGIADITNLQTELNKFATQAWVQQQIEAIAIYDGSVS